MKAPRPENGLNSKEKRELAGMMDAIAAAEEVAKELATKLADPGGDASGAIAEHKAAEAKVERLMARWEDLDARS